MVISHINIIYYLNPKSLQELFTLIITKQDVTNYESKEITDNNCEIIILPCELKRVNVGKTLVIGDLQVTRVTSIADILKKSWKWSENIESGITVKEIAEREKVSMSYLGKVLKLRFLSPKIQKMILLGEQSDKLTSHNLRLVTSMDFKEQEKQIGI